MSVPESRTTPSPPTTHSLFNYPSSNKAANDARGFSLKELWGVGLSSCEESGMRQSSRHAQVQRSPVTFHLVPTKARLLPVVPTLSWRKMSASNTS